MPGKEDIREGITNILKHYYGDCGITHSSVAGAIMECEDRLGVVIKVDRELPDNEIHQPLIGYLNEKIDLFEATCSIQNIFIGAGYEAVESLI